MTRIAVAGGGVAGLSAVLHLLEIQQRALAGAGARGGSALPTAELEIVFIAPLVPGEGSEGSGLGGKAMSRTFVGRYDAAHENMDRQLFYGPAMPESGTVPHGYHVLWGYPNLRRMLTRPGEGPDLSGMLRPPGGSRVISSFQGVLDDPTPGGPGIARMGLCDPDDPATATRDVTRALFRLRDTPLVRPLFTLFELLFGTLLDGGPTKAGEAGPGLKPLAFADLLFATEVDLEMRLALIAAALEARRIDPETATIEVDGVETPLWNVEYDVWARGFLVNDATDLLGRLARLPQEPGGPGGGLLGAVVGGVLDLLREGSALARLVGVLLDAGDDDVTPEPGDDPGLLDDCRLIFRAFADLLADLPAAAARLATGTYPVWRTLHFRFAPDATFASPYSFDAAQAVRSLAFCFLEPAASRMWSADGARSQRLWLRLWENVQRAAADLPNVRLTIYEGRVASTRTLADGRLEILVGKTLGHGAVKHGKDLGYPHQPDLRPPPAPGEVRSLGVFDAFVPTLPPALLADILPAARPRLAPLIPIATVSTELILWTRESIEYGPAAREGLANAAIAGLEGPFCLLADYRCGLWSDEELAKEDPFGDGAFTGSIIESCGGFDDLWAAKDREDAYGWPAEIKEALRGLLAAPEKFQAVQQRAWPHDESGQWKARVADGTWTDALLSGKEGHDDWVAASRWFVWGYLRQLSACQSLGPRAVRQFAHYASLLDPRHVPRSELLHPPAPLLGQVRWVVMRNANRRSRFFTPGVGDWPRRPLSGEPLVPRVYPAGDWTRNGLDVVCMEAACISALRATRSAWETATGKQLPDGVPQTIPVLPPASWY